MLEHSQPVETAPVTETMESTNLLSSPEVVQEAAPVEQAWSPIELSKSVQSSFLADPSLSKFKTVDDLAKAYQNANKLIGKRVQDLLPDEIKALNIKAGAPASKDEYDFKDTGVPEEDAAKYKDILFNLGVPKEAAREFIKWQEQETTSRIKLEEQSMLVEAKQNISSLKEEFGSSFNERIAIANKAVNYLGGEELRKAIEDAGLGTHPAIIKALVKAGSFLQEGTLPAPSSKPVGMTPSEIDASIKSFMSSERYSKARENPMSADSKAVIAELEHLYRLKYNG